MTYDIIAIINGGKPHFLSSRKGISDPTKEFVVAKETFLEEVPELKVHTDSIIRYAPYTRACTMHAPGIVLTIAVLLHRPRWIFWRSWRKYCRIEGRDNG